MAGISIHAPREGGDHASHIPSASNMHFNPRPPRGGRRPVRTRLMIFWHFNPRPPRGGRPPSGMCKCRAETISIHAPREGGDRILRRGRLGQLISIHAPREGGDLLSCFSSLIKALFQSTPPARGATQPLKFPGIGTCDFNPRPPRGGRRREPPHRAARSAFQSTPPARGATIGCYRLSRWICYFNPRPPRGGRHQHIITHRGFRHISIHAPREGGDSA